MKYLLSVLLAGFTLVPLAAKAADVGPSYVPSEPATMSGIYFRGDVGASYLNWGNTSNNWAYVGDFGLGYQADANWRGDVTYNWTGNYGLNPTGQASTSMILGTVYYDFANSSAFTPYVGAGVGYGWEYANGPAFNTSGVAVGLNAGVAYNFTNNLALDVGYRFHDILAASQSTPEHQVAVGLRVKF